MDFDNVHKVFGLINVTRMIGELEKVYRDKTMECIIYEANMRSAYPVEGCCRFIRMLHRSIKRTEAELTITRRLIASLRAHQTPEEAAAAPYLEVEDSQFFDFLQEDAHNNEYYNHLPLPSLQLHQEPNQEQPSADINNALLQEQMLNSRAAPDSGSSTSSRVNHGAERVGIIRFVCSINACKIPLIK